MTKLYKVTELKFKQKNFPYCPCYRSPSSCHYYRVSNIILEKAMKAEHLYTCYYFVVMMRRRVYRIDQKFSRYWFWAVWGALGSNFCGYCGYRGLSDKQFSRYGFWDKQFILGVRHYEFEGVSTVQPIKLLLGFPTIVSILYYFFLVPVLFCPLVAKFNCDSNSILLFFVFNSTFSS